MAVKKQLSATLFALLAAALYAINIPASKLLLGHVAPAMMAAFLYLGAGAGLLLYGLLCRAAGGNAVKEPLTKKELPYTVAMVALDIAAPILLMLGIARTASANVSLLSNFEIAATTLIAFFVFGEFVSKRLWLSVALVTVASVLLGFEGSDSLRFNAGSALALGACACWGLENNCTRKLSGKSSVEIVTIKGCFSGLGSLLVGLIAGEPLPAWQWACAVMALGFVSYGLSIHFYIQAQRELGAAKTSAYYAVAPFLGAAFSMALLGERPRPQFYAALLVMAIAAVLMTRDTLTAQKASRERLIPSNEKNNEEIRRRLRAYNRQYMRDFRDYSCHIRENGALVAGIVAGSTMDTLEVEFLFVEEAHRGKGLGRELLEHAEAQAARDGLKRVLLNTYSFQAPAFYQAMGYTQLLEIDPCFGAYRQYYFQKELSQ